MLLLLLLLGTSAVPARSTQGRTLGNSSGALASLKGKSGNYLPHTATSRMQIKLWNAIYDFVCAFQTRSATALGALSKRNAKLWRSAPGHSNIFKQCRWKGRMDVCSAASFTLMFRTLVGNLFEAYCSSVAHMLAVNTQQLL
jgi:hypothetical protein